VGRRKELPLLERVRITDIGAEGNALARVDNLVVFVPMLIPGDIVDLKIIKKRKKYLEGRVLKFHEYSADRIPPLCKHFGVCGGCKWQHLPYDLQLKYKEKQVRDNLTRIGKVDLPEINHIIGSADEFLYRNKLEYTFSDKRWLTKEEIGSDNKFEKEEYLKLCGQRFWEFISENKNLYTDLIEPLGYKAKEKNEKFIEDYSQLINSFTFEFSKNFCADGKIDWEKLVRLNSAIEKEKV